MDTLMHKMPFVRYVTPNVKRVNTRQQIALFVKVQLDPQVHAHVLSDIQNPFNLTVCPVPGNVQDAIIMQIYVLNVEETE